MEFVIRVMVTSCKNVKLAEFEKEKKEKKSPKQISIISTNLEPKMDQTLGGKLKVSFHYPLLIDKTAQKPR